MKSSNRNTAPSLPIKGRVKVGLSIINNLNIRGKTVVDIGSSFGWLGQQLTPLRPKEYIGIEPNLELRRQAINNNPDGKFLSGDALKIPLKDGSTDIAVLMDVIEHIPKNKERECLREINRVLKADASLVLSTPNRHILGNLLDPAWYIGHRHYEKEFIKKILKESGFYVKSITVRGNLWSFIYLFWLYFEKHVLGVKFPRNKFLEEKDDESFSKEGFHTIFVVAEKKYPITS